MNLQTVFFMGRSAAGKGTQANLLTRYLIEHGATADEVIYVETGSGFRALLKQPSYTTDMIKEVAFRGERQPDFLAVRLWGNMLLERMTGKEHLLFDGCPRSVIEAQMFDTAMTFYKRKHPIILYLNVSNQWAHDRMIARGRDDDKEQKQREERLRWFEVDVVPTIEYFKSHPHYRFVEINGEQAIEEVHREILKSIKF